MCKDLLKFGAGIIVGTLIAKSCLIFGMAAERVEAKYRKETNDSKTEKES